MDLVCAQGHRQNRRREGAYPPQFSAMGTGGERWEGEGDDGFMVLSQNCDIMLVLDSNHAGIKVFSSLDFVLISLHLKPYIVL